MRYPYLATSTEGFVKHIAASLLRHNYLMYVVGYVSDRMMHAPEVVDQALADKYRFDLSSWKRNELRNKGVASVRYVRHGRLWTLFATEEGEHQVKTYHQGKELLFDIRKRPFNYAGYSIRKANGRSQVTIEKFEYLQVCQHFMKICNSGKYRKRAILVAELREALAFDPYEPIRWQIYRLLKAMNKKRRREGLPAVSLSSIGLEWRNCSGKRLVVPEQSAGKLCA